MPQLDLTVGPGELEGTCYGSEVVVALSQEQRLLTTGRHPRAEGKRQPLVGSEADALAQAENRIQHRTRCIRERRVGLQSVRLGRRAPAAHETRPVRLVLRLNLRLSLLRQHVHRPEPRLIRGAWSARGEQR